MIDPTRPGRGRTFEEPLTEPQPRLVFAVTSAVSAEGTPNLAQQLVTAGYELRIISTQRARSLFDVSKLPALAHYDRERHIDLAAWADVVLVAPASATVLSRIARGDCCDRVSATAVATRAPVILVPSMYATMSNGPAVARNLAQLEKDGFHLIPATEILRLLGHFLESRRTINWDSFYANTSLSRVPWFSEDIDPELGQALRRFESPNTLQLLDLGTGPGTLALAARVMGFRVVASDISPKAIEIAKQRCETDINWVVDDIRASTLNVEFDVIVDRGCLHTLARADHPLYAESIGKRLRSGGQLLLKTICAHHGGLLGVTPMNLEALRKLLEPHALELVSASQGRFWPENGPECVLSCWRRR